MQLIILDTNSESVRYLSEKDKRLARVIETVGTISYEPYYDDPYAFLVHEIIEQMLSIKAGARIYERLEDLCGGAVTPPTISALSDDAIRSTGTSNAKVSYIRSLTYAITEGSIDLDFLANLCDDEIIKKLTSIRGIGNWSAKMFLIFVLNRPDILPFEDGAFLQTYRWMYKTEDSRPQVVTEKCKKWSPYSSIAARYLYRALDMGLTKEEFHIFS